MRFVTSGAERWPSLIAYTVGLCSFSFIVMRCFVSFCDNLITSAFESFSRKEYSIYDRRDMDSIINAK